jgi:hypothetical protein
MSVNYNTSIVSDSLLLNLDAGNARSLSNVGTNLLTNPETFNSAAWGLSNLTITPNVILSPNGSATADQLVPSTGGSTTRLITQNINNLSSGTYTFSVYGKILNVTGAFSGIALRCRNIGGTSDVYGNFNLSTGLPSGSPNIAGLDFSAASSTVTSFGNDWYRCSMTFTILNNLSTPRVEIWYGGYQGSINIGNIYIWGAQLEGGTTVSDYYSELSDVRSITWTNLATQVSPNTGIPTTINLIGTPVDQIAFTTAGTVSWVVPTGVTSISAVAVGAGGGGAANVAVNGLSGGGGGGGALHWRNNIPVTPGEILTLTVGSPGLGSTSVGNNNNTAGGESAILRSGTYLVRAGGGGAGVYGSVATVAGGITYSGTLGGGGGDGGLGGGGTGGNSSGGGGGAGGYTGTGGTGSTGTTYTTATAGSGGGGGGGTGQNSLITKVQIGGGGVGILEQGTSGAVPANSVNNQGNPGSGGSGKVYGGGGAGAEDDSTGGEGGDGGGGAVRIIWGLNRSYPNTLTLDQPTGASSPRFSTLNRGFFIFNGTSNVITTSHTSPVRISLSIWWRAASTGLTQYLLDTNTNSALHGFSLQVNSSLTTLTATLGNIILNASSSVTFTPDVWYNIIVTYNGVSVDRYVNGVLVGTSAVSNGPNITYNTNSFNIGASSSGTFFTAGSISSVSVYSKSLSVDEVTQNFNALRGRYSV